ncbi:MAG: V4R domain-containing protein [Candidatus Methanosuratincola sp.]
MSNALDLRRFLVAPGRRLVGLKGVVNGGFRAVSESTSILLRHKVDLRQAFVSCVSEGVNINCKEMLILTFLDLTESDATVEEIADELKSTGYFISLEVIRPVVDGLVADTVSHPLVAGKNRIVILRDLGYRGLLTEIRKLFGTGGEALLYHVGFTTGTKFGNLHRETAQSVYLKDPVEIFKNVSAVMFQWAGFGILEVEELNADGGVIVVKDSFECELGKNSATVYSQFVRGIIAGILAELFGYGFNVVEEECIAKGDQVCRFKLKRITLRIDT